MAFTPADEDGYSPYASGSQAPPQEAAFVAQVREDTAAIRLMVSRFGVNKALDKDQVTRAALTFSAESSVLSARKRLLNTNGKVYKAVLKPIYQARQFWNRNTIAFPDNPGVRLTRKAFLPKFVEQMNTYKLQLADALLALNVWYTAEIAEARARLGELFNPTDYPPSISDSFSIAWDFPNIEPPNHLKQLHPEIYAEEQAKVNRRLEQAVAVAEDAFAVEIQKMVERLADALSPGFEGQKKALHETAVTNMQEFFNRFKALGMCNNATLNSLVEQAERIVGGVDVKDLRKDATARATLADQLSSINESLTGMVEVKTRLIQIDDEPSDDDDSDPSENYDQGEPEFVDEHAMAGAPTGDELF